MQTFHGSCHCGRVRFDVVAQPTRLSQCNCSICRAKGALYIPVGEIQSLTITSGKGELADYRFNTRKAVHYFCRHCGIHTFHRPRISPDRWSVNARCLTDFDLASLPVTLFDGENWEAAARAHGWKE